MSITAEKETEKSGTAPIPVSAKEKRMDLKELLFRNNILIDFNHEILYGSDQVYNSVPMRFGTVGFYLQSTPELNEIADRYRKSLGFKPLLEEEDYGWYDFYITLNNFSTTKVCSSLEFVVIDAQQEDNEEMYHLDLTEEDQKVIYKILDDQCKEFFDTSCEELLNQAEEMM